MTSTDFQFGLDSLRADPVRSKNWGRCGLVCNQSSVCVDLKPSWQTVYDILGPKLICFFSPQHGFESTVQYNMIESPHGVHQPTGLPIFSLYGDHREPTEDMLSGVDTIIFDLPVTGCRIYTYKYTLAGCLRAASKYRKKIVVLDRPNPLGGTMVEGRVLDQEVRSFVGEFSIPIRHGLTMAEIGNYFNKDIGADFEVVSLNHWNPNRSWADHHLDWVLTSPNLPTIDSAYFFVGQVLLEGTNVSEGRGTCLPFQFCGAPYVKNSKALCERIKEIYGHPLEGVFLRPASFEPTWNKWQGQACQGLQLHRTSGWTAPTFRLGLAILRAFVELGDDFAWAQPPYEYDFENLPINLILGSLLADKQLKESSFSCDDLFWQAGLGDYIRSVSDSLLYPRTLTPSF